MTSINDNPERRRLLVRAIAECVACGDQMTMALVADRLPPDFDLIDAELDEALETPQGHLTPLVTTLPDGRPLVAIRARTPAPTPMVEAPAPAPTARLSQQEAQTAIEQAHKRLGLARVAVRVCQSKQQDAKAKLAGAITEWQRGGPVWSPVQERQHQLAAELARKLAGVPNPNRRGNADDFARRDNRPVILQDGTSVPVAKGGKRGALPASYQNRNVNEFQAKK